MSAGRAGARWPSLALAGLAGMGGASAEPGGRFYVLTPVPATGVAAPSTQGNGLIVSVGPVTLPSYLIARRSSHGEREARSTSPSWTGGRRS